MQPKPQLSDGKTPNEGLRDRNRPEDTFYTQNSRTTAT